MFTFIVGISITALFAVLIFAVIRFNALIALKRSVDSAWSGVEIEYRRRFELVPRLVETVTAAAGFEKDLIASVLNARAAGSTALSTKDLSLLDNSDQAISRGLLALAEAYPGSETTAAYITLQEQLAETEDRVAAARARFTANANAYNTAINQIPDVFIARSLKWKESALFTTAAAHHENPRLDLL